jgi:hypothetical protein
MPAVSNILELLQSIRGAAGDGHLYDEVMDEARAALEAAGQARTSSEPPVRIAKDDESIS